MWIKIALPSLFVELSKQSMLIFEALFTSIQSAFEALQVTGHGVKSHFSGRIFSQLNNCICLQTNNLCCVSIRIAKPSQGVSGQQGESEITKGNLNPQYVISGISMSRTHSNCLL